MALLSVDDALALILEGIEPVEAEQVPIAEAHGRVLAEDLAAKVTQPPFDASAMDGYAVRADDVAAPPATLKLVGASAAGAGFKGTLEAGQAVRIFTGAPVPDGADTIVIQEDVEAEGETIVVKEAAPGRHIRPRGQDFTQGEVLLSVGRWLDARAVMLAAAMDYAEVPVRRKPKIAILATGDEVVPPGEARGPDQIVACGGYGLAAFVEANGGEAVNLGIAKDERESIAILAKTGAGADVLVTIGGASVGERDLVASALEGEGLELAFSKLAMRPGKPVLYGKLGTQPVLGLPGNPVSVLVCAQVFLIPLLCALLGFVEQASPRAEAVLGEAVEANGPREHYMRAASRWDEDGTRRVRPLPSQDSSLVAAFAGADCLIVRPPHAPALPEGARVKILPLSG